MKQLGKMSIFAGQRSLAHARRVSLHDADDAIDPVWSYAGSGARASRSRVGRRDVGISSVVDIEKCPLRAFEQDFVPFLKRLVQINHGVGDKRAQLLSGG